MTGRICPYFNPGTSAEIRIYQIAGGGFYVGNERAENLVADIQDDKGMYVSFATYEEAQAIIDQQSKKNVPDQSASVV